MKRRNFSKNKCLYRVTIFELWYNLKDNPIMIDLKSIKDTVRTTLEKYSDEVIFAYLFGSVAKDKVFPLSDVDVAVFLSEVYRESFFDIRLSIHADLCRTLRRNDVDLVVLNTLKNLILLDNIIREGIIIVDKDPEQRFSFELKTLHRAIDFRTQRRAILGV